MVYANTVAMGPLAFSFRHNGRMQRKKLPIGIQTFAKIRGDEYYYVDKTPLALKLIEEGSYYFLSRPRRFGKSLFLDTLGELFSGNEPLFRGVVRARQVGLVGEVSGGPYQLRRRPAGEPGPAGPAHP